MARKIIYYCDKCNKELEIDERLHFEVSVRENFKMNVLKKFDLCKNCAESMLGNTLGFDEIKEIKNFIPERKKASL